MAAEPVATLPFTVPTALRLVRREGRRATLRTPFGLASFDSEGVAIAVALDVAAGSEIGELPSAASQIPHASTVAAGTLVVVLGDADRDDGLFARLFSGGRTALPRAVRASALLARGYVAIGAGVDPASGLDLAWGFAPTQYESADASTEVPP